MELWWRKSGIGFLLCPQATPLIRQTSISSMLRWMRPSYQIHWPILLIIDDDMMHLKSWSTWLAPLACVDVLIFSSIKFPSSWNYAYKKAVHNGRYDNRACTETSTCLICVCSYICCHASCLVQSDGNCGSLSMVCVQMCCTRTTLLRDFNICFRFKKLLVMHVHLCVCVCKSGSGFVKAQGGKKYWALTA